MIATFKGVATGEAELGGADEESKIETAGRSGKGIGWSERGWEGLNWALMRMERRVFLEEGRWVRALSFSTRRSATDNSSWYEPCCACAMPASICCCNSALVTPCRRRAPDDDDDDDNDDDVDDDEDVDDGVDDEGVEVCDAAEKAAVDGIFADDEDDGIVAGIVKEGGEVELEETEDWTRFRREGRSG